MSEKKQKTPSLSEHIAKFEKLVMAKEHETALTELRAIFGILEGSKQGFGKTLVRADAGAEQEATALASAITNLLLDPEFVLKRASLMLFSQHKRVLSQTFEVSGYRGTSHFIRLFGMREKNGNITFKGSDVPKLFCGLSLNAVTEPLLQVFMRQQPDVSWPLTNGFLSEQLLYTPLAEQMRSKLLASGKHWEDIPATTLVVRNLGPAYMGCSYADADHKHDIKKTMNSLARRWLLEKGVTDVEMPDTGRRGVKRKPTLIVMAELYNSTHAMHRCYGPAIRSLQNRFKLVYMSLDGKCDEKLHYMFDKIDNMPFDATNPKAYFEKAQSYRPDVVYFPSVGMRMLSILGTNVRIAPVQLMTYGHPATPRSDNIDYAMIMEGQIGSEETTQEKILYWPAGPRYERRADAKPFKVNIRENPDVVRIAVPAWSRKITPRFFETCKQIQKLAKKKVEFLFFPNASGSLFQAFHRRVTAMVNAQVFPRTDYNSYIRVLNTADIFLSSFPFGATNGILDAGPQGLPIVNLKGNEVHALNDSEMVSHMSQPEWLSADNVEDYIKVVLRLIENDAERVAISKANAAYDYDKGMMVDPDSSCESFGLAVEAAYRHHETLQASPQKGFPFAELEAMMAGRGQKSA